MEDSTATHSNVLRTLTSRLSSLEQDKLSSHMSIAGIRRDLLESRRGDAANFARELIRSMHITLQDQQVRDAYIFEMQQTKTLKLTVIFDNFRTKVSVMKQKRDRSEFSSIYFENAMIPEVRHLLNRARILARESVGLKTAILKSNKVHIVKADDALIAIHSEADIQRAELEYPDKKPLNERPRSSNAAAGAVNRQ